MLVAESRIVIIDHLPALLPREAFVQQRQDLWHVELDIFQVQVILIVLLHLKQIIKLEIQFKETSIATCLQVSMLERQENERSSPL